MFYNNTVDCIILSLKPVLLLSTHTRLHTRFTIDSSLALDYLLDMLFDLIDWLSVRLVVHHSYSLQYKAGVTMSDSCTPER